MKEGGGMKKPQKQKPRAWSKEDKQRYTDRDILKAHTVPSKKKAFKNRDWEDYYYDDINN